MQVSPDACSRLGGVWWGMVRLASRGSCPGMGEPLASHGWIHGIYGLEKRSHELNQMTPRRRAGDILGGGTIGGSAPAYLRAYRRPLHLSYFRYGNRRGEILGVDYMPMVPTFSRASPHRCAHLGLEALLFCSFWFIRDWLQNYISHGNHLRGRMWTMPFHINTSLFSHLLIIIILFLISSTLLQIPPVYTVKTNN